MFNISELDNLIDKLLRDANAFTVSNEHLNAISNLVEARAHLNDKPFESSDYSEEVQKSCKQDIVV